ncbi:MAG TPA: septation protein SepH [Mycobacterium sp.]|nr:septation protein SepH [Mycobacterium sp.]
MRELKVVGLDVDGKHVICEGDDPAEKFKLRADDRLRAAVRGDAARLGQTQIDIEVPNKLRPKEIQARIRAGASVEQVAAAAGVDSERVQRFAHPVLLERSRAAELATAAHPVLADGPAVMTLLETVTSALVTRGLNPDNTSWDAWRNEDGRWTVQLAWKAGRSDNLAHFRFTPGAHGGTVTAVDDTASELIDPDFDRPLRPLAPVAQLDFEEPAPTPVTTATPDRKAEPVPSRRGKPPVPAWEDVLLGVRSGGQR